MTETATTPTDAPPKGKTQKPARKAVPGRGIRKRILGKGEGDYCIYEIAGTASDSMENLTRSAMIAASSGGVSGSTMTNSSPP